MHCVTKCTASTQLTTTNWWTMLRKRSRTEFHMTWTFPWSGIQLLLPLQYQNNPQRLVWRVHSSDGTLFLVYIHQPWQLTCSHDCSLLDRRGRTAQRAKRLIQGKAKAKKDVQSSRYWKRWRTIYDSRYVYILCTGIPSCRDDQSRTLLQPHKNFGGWSSFGARRICGIHISRSLTLTVRSARDGPTRGPYTCTGS